MTLKKLVAEIEKETKWVDKKMSEDEITLKDIWDAQIKFEERIEKLEDEIIEWKKHDIQLREIARKLNQEILSNRKSIAELKNKVEMVNNRIQIFIEDEKLSGENRIEYPLEERVSNSLEDVPSTDSKPESKITHGKATEFNAGYVKGLEETKEIINRKNILIKELKDKKSESYNHHLITCKKCGHKFLHNIEEVQKDTKKELIAEFLEDWNLCMFYSCEFCENDEKEAKEIKEKWEKRLNE